MNAKDIMISGVITVRPDLSVREAAAILMKCRISAVPVVDDGGCLVGILSEGDLIRRAETETEWRRPAWVEFFTPSDILASEFVKAHGCRVADVMTPRVITAGPETPLREIANALEKHRIKRLPIVDGGRMVGIVSRADLLRAVANIPAATTQQKPVSRGENLRDEIVARLWSQSWSHPSRINVVVSGSTVELWGHVGSEAEHKAVRVLTEQTPGVGAVDDHLAESRVQAAL